jgi:DNA-binding IclR family transcriptional regulator
MCLYRVNSPHHLRLHMQPGDTRPMDAAAGAEALRTPYAMAAKMIKPMYSVGATDPHASSMALPIFGAGESLIGALVLSGPASRLTAEQAQTFHSLFQQAALELTRSLGGDALAVDQAEPAQTKPAAKKPAAKKPAKA